MPLYPLWSRLVFRCLLTHGGHLLQYLCSEPNHSHGTSDCICTFPRITVDSTQYGLQSSSERFLRRCAGRLARVEHNVLVQANVTSNLGQIGVGADGLNELLSGALDNQIS